MKPNLRLLKDTEPKLTGDQIKRLMRIFRVSIKSLATTMQITQRRVRYVRAFGVSGAGRCQDWIEGIQRATESDMENNWTDANGREYADFERSGDTFDCADEEMAKLSQARREGRMTELQYFKGESKRQIEAEKRYFDERARHQHV